jgi:hypothetical protein
MRCESASGTLTPCRHCKVPRPGDRRRGLCKPCYRTPAVRRRYKCLPRGWVALRNREWDEVL